MKNLLHEITTTIEKIRSSLHGMTSRCQQLWITTGSWNRRSLVAEHPNCPIKILEILSDDYWPVRFRVTQNPNCPIKLLEKLAGDEFSWVRASVAQNPNCPEYIKTFIEAKNYMEKYYGQD